jgi:hypothetical protein
MQHLFYRLHSQTLLFLFKYHKFFYNNCNCFQTNMVFLDLLIQFQYFFLFNNYQGQDCFYSVLLQTKDGHLECLLFLIRLDSEFSLNSKNCVIIINKSYLFCERGRNSMSMWKKSSSNFWFEPIIIRIIINGQFNTI